jgi:Ca-activated chloride channel family protein
MMKADGPEIRTLAPTLQLERPADPRGLGGLLALAEQAERPLPLRRVEVRAVIAGDCCRTVIEQQYANDLDRAMEAVHLFPLPDDGAVTEMELLAGDVRVIAECRAREQAQEIFEAAREAGHRAGLLVQERPDVHTLRVTNLPPHTEVTVRMVVVERLDSIDGRRRWHFPTLIAPRYLPGKPIGHAGPGVLPDTDQAPDASRLAPPLRLEGGVELDLEVTIHGPLRSLESSLHAVGVDLPASDGGGVRVAPSERATLNKDFVLSFSAGEAEVPALRAWTDGEYTLALLESPQVPPTARLPRDAAFVVDRSGSMRGDKMAAAKLALKTALHGLVAGDRFKLIAFDNEIMRFSEAYSEYTHETLRRADEWVEGIEARGGTLMLPTIQEALRGEVPEGRSRSVLFITDGQAHNVDELVAAVATRRQQARFFTLGIDTAVHASLLKRLARAGGGICELLAPSEDIEAAVARMEARLGDPLVDELRFGGGEPAAAAPHTLFYGRSASGLLQGAAEEVTAQGRGAEGELHWTARAEPIDFPLGALWARERIAWLEDRLTLKPWEQEPIRAEIIRLGLGHGIASRFTAFVAVDTSVNEDGERVEIVQPVELPEGWDPRFRTMTLGSPRSPYPKSARAQYASFPPGTEKFRMAQSISPRAQGTRISSDEGRSAPRHVELSGRLARLQGADGSHGGDVERTAAALVALVLLGNTRLAGLRRRAVTKAARWLSDHRQVASAALGLQALDRAESGQDPDEIRADLKQQIMTLVAAGEEGKLLAEVLEL